MVSAWCVLSHKHDGQGGARALHGGGNVGPAEPPDAWSVRIRAIVDAHRVAAWVRALRGTRGARVGSATAAG